MEKYSEMNAAGLNGLLAALQGEYETAKSKGIKLDMSRGKPNSDQLVFSRPVLDCINGGDSTLARDGTECLNYGVLDGIPEAKRLMAPLLQADVSETFVGGNSSLNLMHDLMVYSYLFTLPGGDLPWGKQGEVKFLCPVPGYDRHFALTEELGIRMISVPMTKAGPDMDRIEALVKEDASVKGMWCVPKYSNPQGITYSDETVRRLAALKPAAKDFRIFWDNAYAVHDLYEDNRDTLLPILPELKKHGNENKIFMFSSTSKITFPGAGVAAVGASAENIAFIKKHMSLQTIGFDKLNQLRHARFFKDMDGITAHMKLHAEKMRPKFEMVLQVLEKNLGALEIANWETPRGGYFISLDTLPGCAKRAVELCKGAGLVMTPAGATHPYGVDPDDKTIRIAPTFPSVPELESAAELFCLCVKLAAVEKLTQ